MKRIRVEISFEATHDEPDWALLLGRWVGYCPLDDDEASDPITRSVLARSLALDVAATIERDSVSHPSQTMPDLQG